MNQLKNNLKELLQRSSKHCNYQVLPTSLRNFVDIEDLAINSRYEVERLEYLLKHIDPRGKSILDIGGNTGYFSFELLEKGASKVIFYEGNNAHADFVTEASKLIAKENLIDVQNEYFQFSKEQYRIQTDIVLLLNVLHHIGDDFGDKEISIYNVKKNIINNLNFFSEYCKFMVFQLGFNWKGDINYPLFTGGSKGEVIEFVKDNIPNTWEIMDVGIPEAVNSNIKYQSLSKQNIPRNNQMGEFLNRPIFILKSKIRL